MFYLLVNSVKANVMSEFYLVTLSLSSFEIVTEMLAFGMFDVLVGDDVLSN